MPKIPRLGDYLTSSDVKDGDILLIVEEPKLRPKEETGFDRDTWGIKVELPNKTRKLWTLNKTTYNALWDTYGDESANWVGKHVHITTERRRVRGEQKTIIYGEPYTPPQQTQIQPQQPAVSNLEFKQHLEALGIKPEAFNQLSKEEQTRLLKKLTIQLDPGATDTS